MKARTIGIVAAAGLAALVGGCKVKHEACQPYYDKGYAAGLQEGLAQCPKQEEPALPEEQIQNDCNFTRNELPDGYKLSGYCPSGTYVLFERSNVNQHDQLWINTSGALVSYDDYGLDGAVEELCGADCYRRGDQGTEEMFAQADKELAQAKKDMGIQ